MDIEKYIDPIYRWCAGRLGNVFDAQDLSQEILLEICIALRTTQVRCMDAWVWQITRNRYARFIGGRRSWISADGIELTDRPERDSSEAEDAAFRALHAIAASHREILVDYYVRQMNCEEIARKHGINMSTVRTRLYYGRDKLKRRWNESMCNDRIYDRLDWYVSGNGDIDLTYLDRQAARSVVRACYSEFRDVEQISEMTGIPCMYVEDELKKLEQGELVLRRGKKYISGIVIHTERYLENARRLLADSAAGSADMFWAAAEAWVDEIRKVGFEGCRAPLSEMGWWLVPLVMRAACNGARRLINFERGEFLLKKDGCKGWIYADEKQSALRGYFSGCNRYYLENSRFRYFWSAKYLSDQLAAQLRRLENVDVPFADPSLVLESVRCGLASIDGNEAKWNIPVFTPEQFEKISRLAEEMADGIAKALAPTADKLLEIMRKDTPAHLHDQLRGIFGCDFNAVIGMMCDVIEADGRLKPPSGEIFAGQVIMIR